MTDFQRVLDHQLRERRVNRFYVAALFAATAVVIAALIAPFGISGDRRAERQLYLTEIASSASSSNVIC